MGVNCQTQLKKEQYVRRDICTQSAARHRTCVQDTLLNVVTMSLGGCDSSSSRVAFFHLIVRVTFHSCTPSFAICDWGGFVIIASCIGRMLHTLFPHPSPRDFHL